jgi:predicted secreted acid phosphatase
VDADQDRIRLQGECAGGDPSTDKECRRQDIAARYHVVLIIGDDLSDFVSVKGLSVSARVRLGRAAASRWGREWIVIPNPTYGSWERAFYDPQQDSGLTILRKKLQALDESP